MTTAKRIDSLMRCNRFTRAELARELSITPSAVTQKFKGDRFTLRDICRIADLFDVSVDYLLGRAVVCILQSVLWFYRDYEEARHDS